MVEDFGQTFWGDGDELGEDVNSRHLDGHALGCCSDQARL